MLLAACALALAACAKRQTAHIPAAGIPSSSGPASAQGAGTAVVRGPMEGSETGFASWYGHPYHGRPAADGEIYDMETMVAAHRTLPFGTRVRVVDLDNGKAVDVRIIDRGPFVAGRIIDLSHAAAEAIDMVGPGLARVRLDILSAPPAALAEPATYAVQVGAFADRSRAEQLRSTMEQRYGTARLVTRSGTPTLWRVLVGHEPTEVAAMQLQQLLGGDEDHCFVVRIDDAGERASR